MRWPAIVCLFFSFISICVADEVAVQFEQANQLYRNGDFQQAASMYEQIVKNGYENAPLLYNLGNVYFKLHNIPAAILNYERAKRLAPRDEDIAYNLRLCNLRIVDKIDAIPPLFFVEWWHNFVNLMPSDEWGLLVIILLWGVVLSGAVFLVSRSFMLRRVTFAISFLSILVCVISFTGMIQRSRIEQSDQQAIVFSQSVAVKSAPDTQSTDLFVLHEGVKVELLDGVAGWKKIRLPDGKVGWMPADGFQVI